MTYEIMFLGIKYRITLSSADITKTERNYGRLQAGAILAKIAPGLVIDALVLKGSHTCNDSDSVTFNELDIKERKTFPFSEITDISKEKGRLAVGTAFFKGIGNGDTIEVILH
jgi:uncharacterized protein YjfI (DUF2170 family)